jgi:hypothetical protein
MIQAGLQCYQSFGDSSSTSLHLIGFLTLYNTYVAAMACFMGHKHIGSEEWRSSFITER